MIQVINRKEKTYRDVLLKKNLLKIWTDAKQNGRLTQHKRFMPKGTYPNFCFVKTSFILVTLYEIAAFILNTV